MVPSSDTELEDRRGKGGQHGETNNITRIETIWLNKTVSLYSVMKQCRCIFNLGQCWWLSADVSGLEKMQTLTSYPGEAPCLNYICEM